MALKLSIGPCKYVLLLGNQFSVRCKWELHAMRMLKSMQLRLCDDRSLAAKVINSALVLKLYAIIKAVALGTFF